MQTWDQFVESRQTQTVGSIYQRFVNQGADPRLLKAQFKDMVHNVLTPQQSRAYALLRPEERAMFKLDQMTANGMPQSLALIRIGEKLLTQHQTNAAVADYHAQNPQFTAQQAKGMYLDKIGSERAQQARGAR